MIGDVIDVQHRETKGGVRYSVPVLDHVRGHVRDRSIQDVWDIASSYYRLQEFRPKRHARPNRKAFRDQGSADLDDFLDAIRSGQAHAARTFAARRRRNALYRIRLSENEDELLNTLKSGGFSKEAETYRQHLERRKEEFEHCEFTNVKFESLKAVARFLVSHDLPFSEINADHEGNADLEWLLSSEQEEDDQDEDFWGDGDGHMILRFVSSKSIRFAILSGPWGESKERLSISGNLSHSKMKAVMDLFKERMVSFD